MVCNAVCSTEELCDGGRNYMKESFKLLERLKLIKMLRYMERLN